MKAFYRDLLKHSGIYGAGQILTRLVSVIMLPVYTHYLSTSDYGCISLLDLTVGILGILIGSGMASAVSRFHFEAGDDRERGQVWWTGLAFVGLVATVVVAPAWLARDALARFTLGPDEAQGGYYSALALPTLWVSTLAELPFSYLRVRKWSGLFLGLSLGRLLLNMGLNLFFLAVLHLGVAGVLLGNLITWGLQAALVVAIMGANIGRFSVRWGLLARLSRFGAPLIITGLLGLVMHQADRYVLRGFLSLDEVGVYALAYNIGQGINSLITGPFLAIWGVLIYEIAKHPDARVTYLRVFRYYVLVLMLLMLGVSLFAQPLVALVASPAYTGAADLIPVVCLAYVFFSLHGQFCVPALLANRTVSLLPSCILAGALNVGLNLLLVPIWGMVAAAWVSVLTFAVYSFVGLWRYRLIERYDYPFLRCALVLLGMSLTYTLFRIFVGQGAVSAWSLGVGALCWLAWALLLFGQEARQLLARLPLGRAFPAAEAARPADVTID